MSDEKALALKEFTPDQLDLIKSTIARNATNDELKLFLYRCKNMGLDPLKPGQIHFVKYGQNPGTMVIGIDGMRARASATGKHVGTKRGVLKDDKGVLEGAWCEVYRKDWTVPAREEVPLKEYNSGKNNWVKMPETMIKKVAEAAALRIAFPDELGGLYSEDELDHTREVTAAQKEKTAQVGLIISRDGPAETIDVSGALAHAIANTDSRNEESLEAYVCKTGSKTRKGKRLGDLNFVYLQDSLAWFKGEIANGVTLAPDVHEDMAAIDKFLEEKNEAPD